MPKGRCLNIGKPCSKAMSGELIEAAPSNFRCPECGSMLMPWTFDTLTNGQSPSADATGATNQPMPPNKGFSDRLKGGPLTIIITALTVVVVGLGLLTYLQSKSKTMQPSIWIADRKIELTIGDNHHLSVVFTPSEPKENIEWKSENSEIVEVKDNMLIAKSEGKALVKVYRKSDPNLCATCEVTVKAPIKTGGTLPSIGETTKGEPNIEDLPVDEFFTDDEEQIEEQIEERKAEEKPIEQSNKLTMTLTHNTLRMSVNDKRKMYAYVKNRAGDNITKVVRWSSDDPSVASVDKTGMVMAKSPGHARIYANTNNEEAFCSVIVQSKEESVQHTKRTGNLMQSCFGGAATYDNKKQVVTFVRDITLSDDDHGDIHFKKGDVITSVSVSDGYLRYGFYNKKKIHLNNINKPF